MLKMATLAMSIYGTYSAGWAANDLYQDAQLEPWASWAMVGFGVLLLLASVIVRVRVPGGLPLAGAALLGLQALDVHNAAHLGTSLGAQLMRGTTAALLMAMAFVGGLPSRSAGKGRADARPSPDHQTG